MNLKNFYQKFKKNSHEIFNENCRLHVYSFLNSRIGLLGHYEIGFVGLRMLTLIRALKSSVAIEITGPLTCPLEALEPSLLAAMLHASRRCVLGRTSFMIYCLLDR